MSAEEKSKGFDQFVILELMGHHKVAGHMTEETIGGASFIRVDIPNAAGETTSTKYYSASAVYGIHPTTKEIAIAAAQRFGAPQPITVWELERVKALASSSTVDAPVDDGYLGDNEDDDDQDELDFEDRD